MHCLKSAQLAHVPYCHGSAQATISTTCGILCHGAATPSLLRHPAWCYGAVHTLHPDCPSASDGQQSQPPISTALLLSNAMACRDPMDVCGHCIPRKQIQHGLERGEVWVGCPLWCAPGLCAKPPAAVHELHVGPCGAQG